MKAPEPNRVVSADLILVTPGTRLQRRQVFGQMTVVLNRISILSQTLVFIRRVERKASQDARSTPTLAVP